MIDGARFDHVAVAAESRRDLERRYAGELGGKPLAGGPSPGFFWSQLEYANGAVVEMLEPLRIEENDFLRRFLDRQGPGPHHLTFTVPSFSVALAAAADAGYPPVGVDDSDGFWKEAFLHPKDAPGVVIQLAESHEHHDHPVHDGSEHSAEFLYVAHAVQSLDDGLRLFEWLLGAEPGAEGGGVDHRWLELGWGGSGRLRLVAPTGPGTLERWLDGRAGRVHHLAFSVTDPAALPGALPRGDHFEIVPESNFGTRLVLVAEGTVLADSTPC